MVEDAREIAFNAWLAAMRAERAAAAHYEAICEAEDGPDEDYPCPQCGVQLEALWSGVRCNACGYWYCA